MPLTYPFFPLSMVAFPGERVNLHIFEPRYQELFKDLQSDVEYFVLIPHIETRLRSVGTKMKLVKVSKVYPSGEMDVVVEGVSTVSIDSLHDPLPGKLYAGGEATEIELDFASDGGEDAVLLSERCADLARLLGAHVQLPPVDADGFSFLIGHRVGLSLKQEYRLLTITEESKRQEFLLKAIERSIRTAERTAEMRRRIQLNGHFRYVKSGK